MAQSLRLLIVEDVEGDALLLVRELRKGGYDPDFTRVETAKALESALANGPWDAVISDYSLPGFTGLDALRIVQAKGLDIPFILVSGVIGEEQAVEAMKAGAHDFVLKERYARLVPALERELREAADRRERTAELARANATLRASEAKYRQLLQSMLDGFAAVDMAGRFTEYNEAFRMMLGYGPDELDRLTYPDITPSRWRGSDEKILQEQILPRGYSDLFEKEFRKKDGTSFPVELRVYLIKDEAGENAGMWAIVRDITQRKKAEEETQKKLSLLNATLEATADGIFVRDLAGTAVAFNRKFTEMWRFPATVVEEGGDKGSRPNIYEQLKNPDQLDANLERWKSDPEYESDDILEFKDGRVFELVTKPQIVKGKVVGRVASYRDISAHRKLEAQLRQSQKLEAIGTLAGGIAHDFNNILNVIVGYASLMEMKLEEASPLRFNVDQILGASERAANLTRSLLVYSRKQNRNPVPVGLNTLIRETTRFLKRLLPENVDFTISLTEEELTILADIGEMEQVIMNLCINARDAMPGGGTLTVGTERFEVDQAFVDAHGYGKTGSHALISVADTGTGMDAQTVERIFEPFFTTKEVGKGTGLGLALVYSTVKQHEGFINVYSEPGHGSTFKIYLPLIAAAGEEARPRETGPATGGTETLLLIEDDKDVRQLLKDVLETSGYHVIAAVDGVDGIVRFKERQDAISLVLTDVLMPRMNGRVAYDEIRKMRGDVKVIFMSGYSAAFTSDILQNENDLAYLAKPVSPREVLLKVRKVLDS